MDGEAQRACLCACNAIWHAMASLKFLQRFSRCRHSGIGSRFRFSERKDHGLSDAGRPAPAWLQVMLASEEYRVLESQLRVRLTVFCHRFAPAAA